MFMKHASATGLFSSYHFVGQYLVGLITFDMSINATYFDLVSHSAELAELIAHELEVDSHQVK